MHTYLSQDLKNIETVTMWVPQHAGADDAEFFFWPALEGLVGILLAGKIKSLRLLFAQTAEDEEEVEDFTSTIFEPITLPNDQNIEEMYAVDTVGYRRMGNEQRDALYKFSDEHKALSARDWKAYSETLMEFGRDEKQKRKLPLSFTRMDCCGIDEGTVIVLTKSR